MSVVTDVLLIVGYTSDRAARLRDVNVALDENMGSYAQHLEPIGLREAGGGKSIQFDVYGGGFNHMPFEIVEQAVAAADWTFPEEVLLVLANSDIDVSPYARTVAEIREDA